MLSITFVVLPRGAWMDEDEVAISIWPSDFEDDGMYDGAFEYYEEGNGPFDSKKFIEFMASRGIEAIEEECEEG